MSTTIPKINAQPRELLGSRNTLRLRKAGQIPVVIYGHEQDPVHASLDRKAFTELAHRNVHLLEVAVGSSTEPCLIKELQWDYLGSQIIHVDLARVDLTEKVEVEVELVIVGEPKGAKEAGAFLQQFLQSLEIECLATQIPENIKVDVSNLGVEEHISVKDLKLPEGIVAITDEDQFVVGVVLAEEEEEAPVAEGATAEPEVIGRKAEDEEGEEEAKPKK
ncbi:MAG: 50S ribosomal protein L25 [Phycisphaeraceae bacterium]